MYYGSQSYDESDDDGSDHLSQAINNGLMAVNQTQCHVCDLCLSSYPSPNSVYSDSSFYEFEAKDTMWRGTDFGSSSPPPFLDDDDDLKERVLEGILDLQDDYLMPYDIPSPLPDLPTPVNDVNDLESDVFLTSSAFPLLPLPAAAQPAVPQNSTNGGVRRRRQRQRQLWQFLLEILCDERYNDIISWVRRDDGVFRFVKPKSVAALWGSRRRRENMSYEHLSRAMRYYYRRGVMKRVVDLGRLVYQFLSNAEGWQDYSISRRA